MAPSNFAEAKHLIKIALNNFLIGTLAVLPIIVVAQIVIFLAHLILSTVFGVNEAVGNSGITLLTFAGVFALLAYIGHTINKRRHSLLISLIDLAIERVPFLNTVYRVTKKIVDMFRSKPDENKREIVYVEYPREGMWLPAYVTNREGDRYVLYVPTSPNPTNGFTVIVHESKVVKSALDISDVTSFVMSVGADFPKSREALELPR
ncbi:DUF502 domain-containing protein [Methylocaldum sp.]|uniref:DUF502 domain-containing protein n=1 Tax=Methylocaldum sp. TaxID=1969727 RepID=UPI002D693A2B|nr:DUF502 domain-containing protein [Methylocaldum sp.]HYE34849.1 DUF502 domain-containing protein [Methylocaldum sp.]